MRNSIWELSVVEPSPLEIGPRHEDCSAVPSEHCHFTALPALFAVCKQIRRESASIFFGGNAFRLHIEFKWPVIADVKLISAFARLAMDSAELDPNEVNLALWTEGAMERLDTVHRFALEPDDRGFMTDREALKAWLGRKGRLHEKSEGIHRAFLERVEMIGAAWKDTRCNKVTIVV